MKQVFPLLLLMAFLSIFSVACQDGDTRKPGSKSSQKKKKNSKKQTKKKNNSTAVLPPISKLKKSPKQTYALLSSVNDYNTSKDDQPFALDTDEAITLKGTAIDKPNKALAAGVYVKIGKQVFKTNYGAPRKKAVERLKAEKYLKSGFSVVIPKAKLKKGKHNVQLLVVAKNRKTYYEQKNKIAINVK